MGQKPKTKRHVKELRFFAPFDSSSRADHYGVVGCQNRIQNGRVMSIESWVNSGVLFLAENRYSDSLMVRYGVVD